MVRVRTGARRKPGNPRIAARIERASMPACAHDHAGGAAAHSHDHDDESSSYEDAGEAVRHFWGTTLTPAEEYTLAMERSGACA